MYLTTPNFIATHTELWYTKKCNKSNKQEEKQITSSFIPGHLVTTSEWHLLCTTHVQTEKTHTYVTQIYYRYFVLVIIISFIPDITSIILLLLKTFRSNLISVYVYFMWSETLWDTRFFEAISITK